MVTLRDQAADLPATREACRARLAELHSEVQSIRTRIAAADLERQRRRGRVDPQQFQEARTSLRDKQSEIERITRHLATLPSRRDAFKDRLIAVLRADYDDTAWQAAVDRARRLGGGLMAPLPPPPTPTLDAIYAAYVAEADDGFRDHLGASIIGKDCERALWYDFRWVTRRGFSGRMLRLFDTGKREEDRLVRDLRRTGATVLDADPGDRPAMAGRGAGRPLRRLARCRRHRPARGAENLARRRVQDALGEIVRDPEKGRRRARQAAALARRCRSTCI